MRLRTRLAILWAGIARARDRLGRRGISLDDLQAKLSPVFVIGANRSGTSVLSSILSQHVDLEGLFGDDGVSRTLPTGHSIGFAESMHVWITLLPDDRERRQRGQWPLWSLPEYLGAVYRSRAKNQREKLELAWAVQRLRRSPNQPLLKDQFNTLRIGLVADVFPKARFVLVSRRFEDFARRGIQKWANDGKFGAVPVLLNAEEPRVSLHWHMVNLIARHDLETYAAGRYTEVWLHELHEKPESTQRVLARVVKDLGLRPQEFDLEVLRGRFGPDGSGPTDGLADDDFKSVKPMVRFERELLLDYFR